MLPGVVQGRGRGETDDIRLLDLHGPGGCFICISHGIAVVVREAGQEPGLALVLEDPHGIPPGHPADGVHRLPVGRVVRHPAAQQAARIVHRELLQDGSGLEHVVGRGHRQQVALGDGRVGEPGIDLHRRVRGGVAGVHPGGIGIVRVARIHHVVIRGGFRAPRVRVTVAIGVGVGVPAQVFGFAVRVRIPGPPRTRIGVPIPVSVRGWAAVLGVLGVVLVTGRKPDGHQERKPQKYVIVDPHLFFLSFSLSTRCRIPPEQAKSSPIQKPYIRGRLPNNMSIKLDSIPDGSVSQSMQLSLLTAHTPGMLSLPSLTPRYVHAAGHRILFRNYHPGPNRIAAAVAFTTPTTSPF